MTTAPHQGILDRDSPALANELRRRVDHSTLPLLHRVYDLACRHGALEEEDLVRAAGASFNPRPARITQIALAEAGCDPFEVAAAALISCARPFELDQEAELPQSVKDTARKVWSALGGEIEAIPMPCAAYVLLAHLVDSARHLHMRSRWQMDSQALISDLRLRADFILSRVPEARNTAVLRTAVERLEKILAA